jgi:hypothetical protein
LQELSGIIELNLSRLLKNIFALLLLLVIAGCSFAQDATLVKKRNMLFAEGGGKAPYYSINYGRMWRPGRKLIYYWRAGISWLTRDISVPFAIGAFTQGSKHHFECSLGFTPYLKDYKTFLGNPDLSDKQVYITPAIGYRFQQASGTFFLGVGIDPLIFMDPPSDNFWNFAPEFKPWAHLEMGVMF